MVFVPYRFAVLTVLFRLAMGVGVLHAQQSAVLLKAHLEPAEVVNADASQLVVELQSTQSIGNLHLEITAPTGFKIVPSSSVDLPAVQGHYTVTSASVVRSGDTASVGSHTVFVRAVTGTGAGATAVADASVAFPYIARISIAAYLLLGGIGILVGYGLRLLINTLRVVAPPPLAPQMDAGAPVVGPITRFVQQHYYLVDCAVTLTVGLLSLTFLLKNNHVPDTGLYWYSTLGAGVALGLLTNSELLSKLR